MEPLGNTRKQRQYTWTHTWERAGTHGRTCKDWRNAPFPSLPQPSPAFLRFPSCPSATQGYEGLTYWAGYQLVGLYLLNTNPSKLTGFVSTFACTCLCATFIYIHLCTFTYIYVYVRICEYMYVYYVYLHVFTYIYVFFTCIYVHLRIFTILSYIYHIFTFCTYIYAY